MSELSLFIKDLFGKHARISDHDCVWAHAPDSAGLTDAALSMGKRIMAFRRAHGWDIEVMSLEKRGEEYGLWKFDGPLVGERTKGLDTMQMIALLSEYDPNDYPYCKKHVSQVSALEP
ncbi:MAG: hypothetical protein RBR86_06615 [Pseudobdellovibrionaceae bacterium]|jgi:hypothetical protein|nr:hypothetical protein [Pseudobdellovibrionaceae bacterium]